MNLQSLITTVLTFIIIAFVLKYAKKRSLSIAQTANGNRVLKCHIIFAILGYMCLLLFIGFLGIILYFGLGSHDNWSDYIFSTIIIGLFIYGGLYLTKYYYNHRVEYNNNDLTVYNAWGKYKTITWKDVNDFSINTNMQEITLYTKDGRKAKISMIIYGLDDFKKEFVSHHPYMATRLFQD